MKTLSLDQAAKRASVSRWTVSRALQKGILAGIRDNRGRWRIEPEALDAWAAEQGTVQHDEQPRAAVQSPDPELERLRAKIETVCTERDQARIEAAGFRAEAAQLRERLEEVRGDRDRWHAEAIKPRPSLLERIKLSLHGSRTA